MARPRKPRYGPWKGIQREWLRLAYDRTDYLLDTHPLSVQPLKTALANAYLQGIADAGEAMQERPKAASEIKQTAPPGLS